MSTLSAIARRPRARTARAVSSAGRRSAHTMSAPSLASASAMARPMPRAEPVTRATRPASATGP